MFAHNPRIKTNKHTYKQTNSKNTFQHYFESNLKAVSLSAPSAIKLFSYFQHIYSYATAQLSMYFVLMWSIFAWVYQALFLYYLVHFACFLGAILDKPEPPPTFMKPRTMSTSSGKKWITQLQSSWWCLLKLQWNWSSNIFSFVLWCTFDVLFCIVMYIENVGQGHCSVHNLLIGRREIWMWICSHLYERVVFKY